MDPMAVLTVLSARGVTDSARSALPDAPVVIEPEHDVTTILRTRAALAAGLRRLAELVAPPRTTVCAE